MELDEESLKELHEISKDLENPEAQRITEEILKDPTVQRTIKDLEDHTKLMKQHHPEILEDIIRQENQEFQI